MRTFFTQFRLLLRLKLLLRSRQPAILALELFWPAIVFLTVLVIRTNFPPNYKNTCDYHARAQPSAGPIHFAQSFMCTAQNECLNYTNYEEVPSFANARIHKIADLVGPFVHDPQSTVEHVPKGVRLLRTLAARLGDDRVQSHLIDGLPLQHILRNDQLEKIQRLFRQNLADRFSPAIIQKAFNRLHTSSLNVIRLLHAFRTNDFNLSTPEEYACSISRLQQYLIFPVERLSTDEWNPRSDPARFTQIYHDHSLEAVEHVLCRLSHLNALESLLTLTQQAVRVDRVLQWIVRLLEHLRLPTLQAQFEHVHELADVMERHAFDDWIESLSDPGLNFTSAPELRRILIQFRESGGGFATAVLRLTDQTTLTAIEDLLFHLQHSSLQLSSSSQWLRDSLQPIRRGIAVIRHYQLQGLFDVQYQLDELVRHSDWIRIWLQFQLELNNTTIEQMLTCQFDVSRLIRFDKPVIPLLCDRSTLQDVLSICPDSIRELAATAICSLSLAHERLVSDSLLKSFVVRQIGNNMIQLIGSEILLSENLSKADLPNAFIGLKTISQALPSVNTFMDEFNAALALPDDIQLSFNSQDDLEWLGASNNVKVMEHVMCGRSMNLLSNGLRPLSSDELPNQQPDPDEEQSLPSSFCQSIYRKLMRSTDGPLVWGWLKPMLRGQVLYAPRSPTADRLIRTLNQTFAPGISFHSALITWARVSNELKSLFAISNLTARLQHTEPLLPLIFDSTFNSQITFGDPELIDRLSHDQPLLSILHVLGGTAECFELNRFVGFDSELEMEEAAKQLTKTQQLIAGVVFLNLDDPQLDLLPDQVHYKIRADVDFVPSTKLLKERIWEPGAKDNFGKDLGYMKGFVQLQELLDSTITRLQLEQLTGNHSELLLARSDSFESYELQSQEPQFVPEVQLQQMPYGCYKEDKFGFYMLALSPVISTVAWIFLIAFSIREFVLERELRLEEMLMVTGLRSSVRWWVWFLIAFSVMSFGCACGLTIFRLAFLMPNSNFLLVYLYFLTFCLAIVMYCYMISSLFKTATIASLSGIIGYLASYLPFMVAITLEHELTLFNKLFSCLSMSTSFCFGIMYLARFETQGVGIQWENVWQSPMAEDSMNFGYAGLMMLFDAMLYFIIGWYIANVHPATTYGKKPWYFFLLPSYWGCGGCPPSCSQATKHVAEHRGMSVHNLHVIYNANTKREHQAVSNLSLQLQEGEISTLLGKNGAGKTSTISVLTGTLAPTSGFVYVYGSELQRDYQRARRLLGYCPQYNVLFGHLTVREHLLFFCRLKGVLPECDVKSDVDRLLSSTGLLPMQNQQANQLSGGLQRRLCVALAFVGGSKLIVLDEPTSSVDPLARRQIWDLIVQQKQTRTVLLTTHHMDEADILSDQVAIIHQGRLLCSGSPLLLKSKFGCGYRLTVSKHDANSDTSDQSSSNESPKLTGSDNADSSVNRHSNHSNQTFRQSDSNEEEEDNTITDSDSGRVSNNSAATNSPTAPTKNQMNLAPFEPLKSFVPVKQRFAELDRIAQKKTSQHLTLPLPPVLESANHQLLNQATKLMQFINCLIPNAARLEDADGQLLVALPRAGVDGQPHDYSTFFSCLDANLARFGFHSYGLSSTTLEEVFLGLCAMQEANLPLPNTPEAQMQILKHLHLSSATNGLQAPVDSTSPSPLPFSMYASEHKSFGYSPKPIGFLALKAAQFRGLLLKRAYHTFTNWRTLFYNLVMPCVFIAFAMGMTTIKPTLAPDPILPLNPAIYGSEATSFVASRLSSDVDSNAVSDRTPMQSLEKQLQFPSPQFIPDCAPPRFGWKVAKCSVVKKNFVTEFPPFLRHFQSYEKNAKATCECAGCERLNYAGLVPEPTGTIVGYVYNVTEVDNLRNFLLSTYPLFNDRRYGGWSLHTLPNHPYSLVDESKLWFSESSTIVDNDSQAARAKRETTAVDSLSNKNVSSEGGRSLIKIWFDNNGMHALPSYVNALSNAILRANLALKGVPTERVQQFAIHAYSQPFHIRSAHLGDQNLMQKAGDAGIALIILVGFSFVPISFVFYLVRERSNEEKHMQRMLGVGTWLYWSTALIWDLLMVCAGVVACVAILWMFHLPIYTARLNLPAIALLLLLFGWAMCGAVHLVEKLFSEPSIAFMVIYCATLFVGIHTMLLRLLVDVFQLLQVSDTFRLTCERLALAFPPFALMSGLVDVTKNHLMAELYLLVNQDVYVNPFSMRLLGMHYITLAIEGAVLIALNLLFELIRNGDLWFVRRSSTSTSSRSHRSQSVDCSVRSDLTEDTDVAEERRRVLANGLRTSPGSSASLGTCESVDNSIAASRGPDVLRVVNVSKEFDHSFGGPNSFTGRRRAVDCVTFAVRRGECFGLLGVNGAGKTTLFKILTGQLRASGGLALLGDQQIGELLAGTCTQIGYCPQADALDMALTPRQHLNIYATLRGLGSKERETVVKRSLQKFQLMSYEHFPVQTLSRGNRRKLCLAIAMLGDPQIILLDEPTSGMDPMSRRFLWHNIQNAIRQKKSVLLTSHSMEECDVLCSRLAIMVNGRFSCLGSPQYLKHRFGSGYTITLRLNEMQMNSRKAISFIRQCFPTIVIRAHHHNMLEFSLPTNNIPLSSIFSHLEDAKSILQLQDYSVSQTTLDQVFVTFASLQNNDLHLYHESNSDHSSLSKTSEIEKEQPLDSTDHSFPVEMVGNTNAAFDCDSTSPQPPAPLHEPEPDYFYQQAPSEQPEQAKYSNLNSPKSSNHPILNASTLLPRGCQTTRPKRHPHHHSQNHYNLHHSSHHHHHHPQHASHAAISNMTPSDSNYPTMGLRALTSTASAATLNPRLSTFAYSFTPNHHLYGYSAAYAAYAAGWNSQPPPPLTYATLGSRHPLTMSGLSSPLASSYIPRPHDPSQRTKRKKR